MIYTHLEASNNVKTVTALQRRRPAKSIKIRTILLYYWVDTVVLEIHSVVVTILQPTSSFFIAPELEPNLNMMFPN